MEKLLKDALELSRLTSKNVTVTLNERQATMLLDALTDGTRYSRRAEQLLLEMVEAT